MKSINPTTGEVIATYEPHSPEDVEGLVQKAHKTFGSWKKTSFEDRAQLLEKLADELIAQKDDLAKLMTSEMGKLLTASHAEVEKCAWVCRHYAKHGANYLTPEQIQTDATMSYVHHAPLGVILAIMPWNFPLWQVFRFIAPTLMAGNVGVLKHASNVQGCAAAITGLFKAIDAPDGLFQHLFIPGKRAQKLVEHERIRGVSLTGSLGAGSAVARTAGEYCKPVILELGGSDPFIVLHDADLDLAVEQGIKSRFLNNGQSCIAAKRFIVDARVHDAFLEKMTSALANYTVGDPMDESSDMGPMARGDLRKELDEQVSDSVNKGANIALGGSFDETATGFYYPATVLTNVSPGMPAFDEELFGPVAAIIKAKDTTHAIELANQTDFGLGSSLWTKDMHLAVTLAPQIEAGSVFINGLVKSDPRLPFGGIKISGLGRELGKPGILAFVNTQTVWIK